MLRTVTIYSLRKRKVESLSHVRLFATPWTIAYQAPPSMGFSRQQCWSGLPFPSPGYLLNPGIKPRSPTLQADPLPSEPLKLKLQYFGHLMRRVDSLEKTWCLEGLGARREGDDGWMASRTLWTWVWVNSGSWWWSGRPGVLWFMDCKESDTTEWLNWTENVQFSLYWMGLPW